MDVKKLFTILSILLIYLSTYSYEIKHQIFDAEVMKNLTIEELDKLKKESEFIGVEVIAKLLGIYDDKIYFNLRINNYSRIYPTLKIIPLKDNARLYIPPNKELKPMYYDKVFDEEIVKEAEGKVVFKNLDNKGRRIVTNKTKWLKLVIFNLFKIDSLILLSHKEDKVEFVFELNKKHNKIKKIDETINKGIKAYKKGNLTKAIEYFEEARKLDNERIDIYNLLAEAYLKKGLIDMSIKILKEAIEKKPEDPLTHYNLGIAYREKKELQKAEIEFTQAIAAYEDYIDAYYYLALTYFEQNKLEEASKTLYKLLSIDEKNKKAKELLNKIKL